MNIIEEINKGDDTLYLTPTITEYTISDTNMSGYDKVIKFQNGMMIIAGRRSFTSSASSSATFSVAFINSPIVQVSICGGTMKKMTQIVSANATSFSFGTRQFESSTGSDLAFDYLAIGKWK